MIPVFDSKKKFWVIRADGGHYFNDFLQESFVGLSHVDKALIFSEKISEEDLQIISTLFPNLDKRYSRRQQVFRFINKIQINDWIITVGKNSIAIGVVNSEAYLDGSGFSKNYLLGLRRKVSWGAMIPKHEIPSEIQTSLKCNQSLFNVDKYHEAIYHSLFPFFIKNGKLHATIKINTNNHIETKDIINIFRIIDEVNSLSKQVNNGKKIKITSSYVKADFKSPGDIWAIFNDIKNSTPTWMIISIGLLATIFGYPGYQGVITPKMREKILDVLLEKITTKEKQKSIEKLKISTPENNFEKLIPDSEKKEPRFDIE